MGGRWLGSVSLAVSASGYVVLAWLRHQGWCPGWGWSILEAGCEAGTIGGAADWFAVRALFHPIPIPFLRRHTDILVRNRPRLTQGVADMVQNRWLSPAAISERLDAFSISTALIGLTADPAHRTRLATLVRSGLARLLGHLAGPVQGERLRVLLRSSIIDLDLARPLAEWLTIAQGRHGFDPVWQVLLDLVAGGLTDPTISAAIESKLELAARSYKEQGLLRRLLVGSAEAMGAIDYRDAARRLLERAAELVREARDQPGHPLRGRLDRVVADFTAALSSGDPTAAGLIHRFKERLVDSPRLAGLISTVLGGLHQGLSDGEAGSPGADLVSGAVDAGLSELGSDPILAQAVDDLFRNAVVALVERHGDFIGDIVRTSLDPTRLSDRDLAAEIELHVGDDLQYIRLNGAVVGALVGVLLALIRHWLWHGR